MNCSITKTYETYQARGRARRMRPNLVPPLNTLIGIGMGDIRFHHSNAVGDLFFFFRIGNVMSVIQLRGAKENKLSMFTAFNVS